MEVPMVWQADWRGIVAKGWRGAVWLGTALQAQVSGNLLGTVSSWCLSDNCYSGKTQNRHFENLYFFQQVTKFFKKLVISVWLWSKLCTEFWCLAHLTLQVGRSSASSVAFGMGMFAGQGTLGSGKQRAFSVVTDSKANDIHLRFHDTCMVYKVRFRHNVSECYCWIFPDSHYACSKNLMTSLFYRNYLLRLNVLCLTFHSCCDPAACRNRRSCRSLK